MTPKADLQVLYMLVLWRGKAPPTVMSIMLRSNGYVWQYSGISASTGGTNYWCIYFLCGMDHYT
jgi:hypothetical protein